MSFNVFTKVRRSKNAIVRLNVSNLDAVMGSKVFEGFFGDKCFFDSCRFLKVAVEESTIVIDP